MVYRRKLSDHLNIVNRQLSTIVSNDTLIEKSNVGAQYQIDISGVFVILSRTTFDVHYSYEIVRWASHHLLNRWIYGSRCILHFDSIANWKHFKKSFKFIIISQIIFLNIKTGFSTSWCYYYLLTTFHLSTFDSSLLTIVWHYDCQMSSYWSIIF